MDSPFMCLSYPHLPPELWITRAVFNTCVATGLFCVQKYSSSVHVRQPSKNSNLLSLERLVKMNFSVANPWQTMGEASLIIVIYGTLRFAVTA